MDTTPCLSGRTSDHSRQRYLAALIPGLFILGAAFFFSSPSAILDGLVRILRSRDNLITDYMAVGGVGAALFNAALMYLLDLLIFGLWKVRLQAQHVAALMSVLGFSLFGKNLLNSLPLSFGVLAYSFWRLDDPRDNTPNMLFVGCLGPVVTELWLLNEGWSGLLLACCSGFLIGFIFTPLSQSFVRFHQGFSLYNAGFTGGFLAMMVRAVLRTAGHHVEMRQVVLSGHSGELLVLLLLFQAGALAAGFLIDRRTAAEFRLLLQTSGVNQENYWESFGAGASLVNAACLGMAGSLYVLLVGGEFNGPIVGGIFNLMGFAFIGKNLRSALPVFGGAYLASILHIYNPHAAGSLLGALFGCTLCPISGYFGILPGIAAGFLNMALLSGVGELNSGLNLYNNGFSGGFVAAFLVPLLAVMGLGRKVRKSGRGIEPADKEAACEDPLDHAVSHTPIAEKAEAWDRILEE